MEFYTQNGITRPIRLSESTRKFGYDSLARKYGLDTLKTEAICLDNIENIKNLPPLEKYNIGVRKICEEAPIRICQDEKLSGAATLGLAIQHFVPAIINNEPVCQSISHLTVDFETVLKKGLTSFSDNELSQIKEKLERKYPNVVIRGKEKR